MFRRTSPESATITVHLRRTDFRTEADPPYSLDVVVGCCFADLFDPEELAASLVRFTNGRGSGGDDGYGSEEEEKDDEKDDGGTRKKKRRRKHSGSDNVPPLVYFPITLAGTTRFSPSRPSEAAPSIPTGDNDKSSCARRFVPADDAAFRIYASSLLRMGHNLDPSKIVDAVRGRGGGLLAKDASPWRIEPAEHGDGYLLETMMYFFGTSGGREMESRYSSWDVAGWIKRARQEKREIVV